MARMWGEASLVQRPDIRQGKSYTHKLNNNYKNYLKYKPKENKDYKQTIHNLLRLEFQGVAAFLLN